MKRDRNRAKRNNAYNENVKKKALRQYKLDLKRIGRYLIYLIPIAFVEAFLISMLDLKIWVNVVIVVPTLLIWCVIFEVIHVAVQKRKDKKAQENPKKHDIYSD